jgi:hypothetical protein
VRGPLPTAAPPPTAGAPSAGQHTAELLAELGYRPERVAELAAAGAVTGEVGDLVEDVGAVGAGAGPLDAGLAVQ